MGERKMIREERFFVKEIDEMIKSQLEVKLEIKKEKVNNLEEAEIEKILTIIKEKKNLILALFQGDFSLNEYVIKQKMKKEECQLTSYEKIANRIILKRIDEIFDMITKQQTKSGRLISVCADRQFFIKEVISSNIQKSFIEDCIELEEIRIIKI